MVRCYGRSDGTPPNPIGVRTRQCSYTSINAAADAFGLRVRCLPGADIWCVLSTAHSRRATEINAVAELPPQPPEPAELVSRRVAARYRDGATLDQLAVEFGRSESVIGRLLDAAGVERRPFASMPPRPAWFDLAGIPLQRQKEIAELYRLYPAHEVAGAYGLPIRAVERIAARYGVRKRAPNGYHRVGRLTPGSGDGPRARSIARPTYRVTALLVVDVAAASVPDALAIVGTAGASFRIASLIRVDAVQLIGPPPMDPPSHTNLQEGHP